MNAENKNFKIMKHILSNNYEKINEILKIYNVYITSEENYILYVLLILLSDKGVSELISRIKNLNIIFFPFIQNNKLIYYLDLPLVALYLDDKILRTATGLEEPQSSEFLSFFYNSTELLQNKRHFTDLLKIRVKISQELADLKDSYIDNIQEIIKKRLKHITKMLFSISETLPVMRNYIYNYQKIIITPSSLSNYINKKINNNEVSINIHKIFFKDKELSIRDTEENIIVDTLFRIKLNYSVYMKKHSYKTIKSLNKRLEQILTKRQEVVVNIKENKTVVKNKVIVFEPDIFIKITNKISKYNNKDNKSKLEYFNIDTVQKHILQDAIIESIAKCLLNHQYILSKKQHADISIAR